MSDTEKQKKQLSSRRQLLKATIIGTGAVVAGKSLPKEWAQPVVESVMLPAHAQTSLTIGNVGGPATGSVADASDWLLDKLVPTAMAGGRPFPDPEGSVVLALICVQGNDDGTVNFQALIQYGGFRAQLPYFTGTNLPLNTTVPLILQNPPCDNSTMTATVNVVPVVGGASGTITIEDDTNGDVDTMGEIDFEVTDPGCPIELPVPGCDTYD